MTKEKKPLDEVKESLDFLGDTDLADVKFDLKQAQDLTGIKKGRIQYWTDSGYIRELDGVENGRYHYTPKELRRIKLIGKFYKNGGYTLEAAAKKAEEILSINDDLKAEVALLITQSFVKGRLDVLADKLAESGLAEDLIDILRKDEVKVKNVETEGPLLDKRLFLQKARIPIGEVNHLVEEVTPRQICYWTKQGYVSSERDNPYRFDFRSIQKINLISNFLESGSSLEEAAAQAEQVLDRLK